MKFVQMSLAIIVFCFAIQIVNSITAGQVDYSGKPIVAPASPMVTTTTFNNVSVNFTPVASPLNWIPGAEYLAYVFQGFDFLKNVIMISLFGLGSFVCVLFGLPAVFGLVVQCLVWLVYTIGIIQFITGRPIE